MKSEGHTHLSCQLHYGDCFLFKGSCEKNEKERERKKKKTRRKHKVMCLKNHVSAKFQAAIHGVHRLLLISALCESQQGGLKLSRGCDTGGQAVAWQGSFLIPILHLWAKALILTPPPACCGGGTS